MANGRVQKAIARRAHVPVDSASGDAPPDPDAARGARRLGQAEARHGHSQVHGSVSPRHRGQPDGADARHLLQDTAADSATLLANAAVAELRAYLGDLATSQRTPEKDRIRLIQLGRAQGEVINGGIDWQLALVAFVLTFGVAYAVLAFLARVRQRWRVAALSERAARG